MNTVPGTKFTTLHFICSSKTQYARVLHYTKLERFASGKHSGLKGPVISYNEMKCFEYGPRDYIQKLPFLCNLQMGPISASVILHLAEKACQGQILQPLEP